MLTRQHFREYVFIPTVDLWIATLCFLVVGLCTFDKCYWILLTYLLPQLPCQSLPVPFRRFFVCLLATLHKNGFAWNFQGRWVREPPKFQIWKSSLSARKVRGSTWHTDQREIWHSTKFSFLLATCSDRWRGAPKFQNLAYVDIFRSCNGFAYDFYSFKCELCSKLRACEVSQSRAPGCLKFGTVLQFEL